MDDLVHFRSAALGLMPDSMVATADGFGRDLPVFAVSRVFPSRDVTLVGRANL